MVGLCPQMSTETSQLAWRLCCLGKMLDSESKSATQGLPLSAEGLLRCEETCTGGVVQCPGVKDSLADSLRGTMKTGREHTQLLSLRSPVGGRLQYTGYCREEGKGC